MRTETHKKQVKPSPLQRAVDICGGQTALKNRMRELDPECKVTQAHIYNWLNRSSGNRSKGIAPPEYCALIERAVDGKVTREDFYPDCFQTIWPELSDAA